jgi:hypothetical protein
MSLFRSGTLDRLFPSLVDDYHLRGANDIQMYDIAFPQALDDLSNAQISYPEFFDPSDGFLSGAGFFNIPTSNDVVGDNFVHRVQLNPRCSRKAFIHYWISRYLSACCWLCRLPYDPVGFILDFMVAPVFIRSFSIHEVVLAENNPLAFTSGHIVVPVLSTLFFIVPSATVKILLS